MKNLQTWGLFVLTVAATAAISVLSGMHIVVPEVLYLIAGLGAGGHLALINPNGQTVASVTVPPGPTVAAPAPVATPPAPVAPAPAPAAAAPAAPVAS